MYDGYLEFGGVEQGVKRATMTDMTTCTGPDCDRDARAQKNPPLCSPHYYQMKKHGVLTPIFKPKPKDLACTGPECARPEYATGLCRSHYEQKRKGRPLSTIGTNVGKRTPWCREPGCPTETPSTYCDTHRLDHFGKCLCCGNSRSSTASPYCETHKRKDRYLRHAYGISAVQHQELMERAGWACEMCRSTDDLHVDHCHDSGKVRGILCGNCNRAIGLLQDNVAVLTAGANYLNERGAELCGMDS